MTAREAATYASVSEATILRWIEEKLLKASKTTRKGCKRGIIRIHQVDLNQLLEGTTTTTK
jgi:excisionase family DNA binding protein